MSEVNHYVDYRREGGIAFLSMCHAPVNTLSYELRCAIDHYLDVAEQDQEVKALVLRSELSAFSAGADISEFGTEKSFAEPSLPALCDRIDRFPKWVIAEVAGYALGGGLELALAADKRIATRGSKLGLPEVNLGILPGAGGTQRLPRLIAPSLAARMMCDGKPISSEQALDLGLVNALLASSEHSEAAIHQLLKECEAGTPDNMFEQDYSLSREEETALLEYQAQQARRWTGLKSPQAIIEAVQRGMKSSLEDALALERKLFNDCAASPQARALQHAFFAEKDALKVPGINRDDARLAIQEVAIIGSGLMGCGIAINFLLAGIPTRLLDVNSEALEKARAYIQKTIESGRDKGRISAQICEQAMAALSTASDYEDIANADLVIEAVFEDLTVKQSVFKELNRHCKAEAILASNTSTLDLNAIADVCARPENVIGLHFFSPANIMKLLEVVRTERTSEPVLATCLKLAKKINKVAVTVGVCYGFVGNRMVAPYSREAFRMVLEGASPSQVDSALREFGMAMGPIEMADMAGIDVGCMAALANQHEWQGEESYQALQFALREQGRLGQKTSAGVYRYDGGKKQEDPEVLALAKEIAQSQGIEQRNISKEEIIQRCIFSLANEGFRILEEGIALRSGDIDVIYLNGYGFPRWRGGPMQYADETGLQNVLQGLENLQKNLGAYGERWFAAAPLLKELAQANRSAKSFSNV
ncbi:3-hydroxyacyl-CoA dehydrogenase NAD-binding domain-containing protein [Pseudoteredinibacter isoporae]|uniref:3-hydroxyacyl-CoA dehydrogenase n=1 Tax=Pseudoteredinibacter isoporae TaxID=570281 RepID=A0A7X0MWB1_9GAMM|nr:3-hydroxyacyl-CoA dehydrogenase NAD-binding domain-containing protein [Pseudoteredinibacter isoporae]MBB6520744.1 3-hydroxyacyl-CoA dehydrogenase [Pseudoteredinibacter isoporae]NHO86311.1 3-hydroxyacyl-CoA dehydrogenase [Pseudoteredinibacter isoporae]NIB25238.1 3-hydroxyacyl-CoA dehydrogenase [Pseudoteredinibacter isoporae]